MACYSHIEGGAKLITFVPIVGAFAGGANVRSEMPCFQFGSDGRVTGHTINSYGM